MLPNLVPLQARPVGCSTRTRPVRARCSLTGYWRARGRAAAAATAVAWQPWNTARHTWKCCAAFDVDGQVTPLSITWRDGRTFPIDRVEEAIRRASARVGGTGVRYRVSINGRDKYLFFEDPRWFVEEVVPTLGARVTGADPAPYWA